jgi:phosphatidylserine decarboxylase
MKFASEAWMIVLPFFVLALLAAAWGWFGRGFPGYLTAVILAVVGCAVLLFFRDPTRRIPAGRGAVVSPADGKVLLSETLDDGRKHVAIFMSVFNVHVNRVPYSSEITRVIRTPGTYVHAGTEEAAGNARVDVEARSEVGPLAWRQVSGLIARKISCRLKAGDRLQTGDRFGLIYFGSRMDVYLPAAAQLMVEPGQRVLAGESMIAQF